MSLHTSPPGGAARPNNPYQGRQPRAPTRGRGWALRPREGSSFADKGVGVSWGLGSRAPPACGAPGLGRDRGRGGAASNRSAPTSQWGGGSSSHPPPPCSYPFPPLPTAPGGSAGGRGDAVGRGLGATAPPENPHIPIFRERVGGRLCGLRPLPSELKPSLASGHPNPSGAEPRAAPSPQRHPDQQPAPGPAGGPDS